MMTHSEFVARFAKVNRPSDGGVRLGDTEVFVTAVMNENDMWHYYVAAAPRGWVRFIAAVHAALGWGNEVQS